MVNELSGGMGSVVRRIAEIERRAGEMQFSRPRVDEDHWRSLHSLMMTMPGRRAVYVSGVNSSGDWIDDSGNGLDLGINGDPEHGLIADFIPAWDYDAAGDYHSRATEADYDILGNESYIASASQGLTIHTVVLFDVASPASTEYIVAKDAGGGQSSYRLVKDAADDTIRFSVYNGAWTNINSANSVTSTTQWQVLGGVWFPGTSLSVWVNGSETESVAAIPAAPLTNSNADFTVAGSSGGGSLMNGMISVVGLYAEAHSDDMMQAFYQNVRALYGLIV
jgi:hypothetical protein